MASSSEIVPSSSEIVPASSASNNKIVLTSSDGASFEVDEAVAREFQIVAHMIDDDCAGNAIPLANLTGDILSKAIEYCKKHVEEGGAKVEGEENEEAKKNLQTWDEEFMKNLEMSFIFRLILAANYLNIKGLLELTCQTVADHIKDMQPEEIRKVFNIENDFTPEEEEKIRKENEWAFN
ncbi:hypothetical protein AALP_AA5G019200 [Arabis alpina]|uniref:SKP1-like protein n=1 Tax=Arabis alpina TaxID=50452 RepID=A0A087GUD2_ARAAL|nr:hypothetical protein AALP_AA5G019200 [Arabis alpina]